MARWTGGFLCEGLSGRVGNAVLRERPLANDLRSPAQIAQRTRVARAWSEPEAEEVTLWAAYAAKNLLPALPGGRRGGGSCSPCSRVAGAPT